MERSTTVRYTDDAVFRLLEEEHARGGAEGEPASAAIGDRRLAGLLLLLLREMEQAVGAPMAVKRRLLERARLLKRELGLRGAAPLMCERCGLYCRVEKPACLLPYDGGRPRPFCSRECRSAYIESSYRWCKCGTRRLGTHEMVWCGSCRARPYCDVACLLLDIHCGNPQLCKGREYAREDLVRACSKQKT